MFRIALLNVWFGRLPAWIDQYIETCRFNPSVDWYLLADGEEPNNRAENFHFVRLSTAEFNRLAQDRLGLSINVTNGYKLCDFRPTFGELFVDKLAGFDFWGHCDLDILWGDLRAFLSEELLDAYDIISTNPDGLNGPLTIYRNLPAVNRLYRRGPIEEILTDPANRIFDEHGFDAIVKAARDAGEVRLFCAALHEYDGFHPGITPGESSCSWRSGKLFCTCEQRELMYFHFAQSKYWSWPQIWRPAADAEPSA